MHAHRFFCATMSGYSLVMADRIWARGNADGSGAPAYTREVAMARPGALVQRADRFGILEFRLSGFRA